MDYRIDTRLESRIDRERYIGKQFTTNQGYDYIVLGVWEYSPIGKEKRYVIEFEDGEQSLAYSSTIKNGSIGKYKGMKLHIKRDKPIKTILLMSDLHFCYEDKDCLDIFYQVASDLRDEIDELVDLGDGINNNSLSKFIDIEPTQYTLIEEVEAYRNHIMKMKEILNKDTKFVVLQDNHFHLRKERWLAENPMLRGLIPDLSPLFDIEVEHGVPYMPFNQNRFGLIHGISYGKFFTKQHIEQYGIDIICGHTHTMQMYTSSSGRVNVHPIRSYGVPCMSKHQRYMQGRPTRQICGFGVLTYDTGTNNYNIEYVIVENKSAIFRGKKYESNYIGQEELMN